MTIGDLVLEIYALTDTDSTSYSAATMLRRINAVYEKVVGMLIARDGAWEFDDINFTDFPRGKATMVEAQADYSFDSSHLSIEEVQVLGSDGKWHKLTPVDKRDFDVPLSEYFATTGLPTHYDKDGSSILLYPAPTASQVTLASGLQVHFRRTADKFTSAQVTTGTKEPGFASPYHMVIAYGAALPYCMANKKDRIALYKREYDDLMKEILGFYSRREKDVRDIITTKNISFR